ncbi:MAG: hypothetical protein A3J93_00315 [Candidatus Magasanikbacteria bacterium RIFOXYC2_FULL_42_28]|uniref:DUF721 domain-containing protein n=1 Tax=Candidatus Magasanikbacteria bacterium RIFOXYC2_FULL_42_28 TaxID=1798704 RepID=A0A1F6NW53_9BACT|nr:MAG: hypothetical protein A3J93_00315 [Candidatus Magasanikbacteria bacterium RIFOXYC2_FULL_42_28]
MQTLGSLLNRPNQNRPLLKQVRAAMVVEAANEFISKTYGQGAENQARALYLKNGILTIACLSSVLAQEMRLREKELLRAVSAKFSPDTIKKVRYLA